MAQAWGDVPVHSIKTDLGHDRKFIFTGAATSDAQWLIGSSQPREFDVEVPVTWGRSDAVLVRVSDGSVHAMARLTSPSSQLLFTASDGPWVVWLEADDQPVFYNWRLMVYNLDTGTTRELAHALHKNGAVLEGPWPVPWVSHDLAVWGQAIGPLTGPDPLKNNIAREADLRTDDFRTLADHAGLPAISWPWVAWQVADVKPGHIQLMNMETGQQERLEGLSPTFTINGVSASYNTSDLHAVCLIEDLAAAATARPIVGDPDIYYEYITLNDRAVGYRQIDDLERAQRVLTQVYDRRLQVLIDLPIGTDLKHSWAAGPVVVWQTSTNTSDTFPAFIRVVDTRDIAD